MSGNRSLDEFADAVGGEGTDGSDGSDGDRDERGTDDGHDADDGAGDSSVDREEPGPPASTYVWSPDGGTCAGCGEAVEERWRDGDDLVCAGCKEW